MISTIYSIIINYVSCSHVLYYTYLYLLYITTNIHHYIPGFPLILLEGVTAGFCIAPHACAISFSGTQVRSFSIENLADQISDQGKKVRILIWGTSPSQITVSKFKSVSFSHRSQREDDQSSIRMEFSQLSLDGKGLRFPF